MPSFFSRRVKRSGLAAVLVLAAFAAVPALAGAATFNVDTTADLAPAPGACQGGGCSLRQAIALADKEAGSNRVVMPAGHYLLTIAPTGGDEIGTGDLNVKGDVNIEGAGARQSVIDASGIIDRVINFEEGSLRLVGLGITGGRTEDDGGAIYQEKGSLRLEGVAVTNNVASGSGYAGGIYTDDGNLAVLGSTLSGNRNSGDGGAVAFYGETLTIENSTLADNEVNTALYPSSPGWGAYGGAIEANGDAVVMKNATIVGNHIVDNNGGEEGQGAALAMEFETFAIANTIVAENTGEKVEEAGQCVYEATFPSLGHNLETAAPLGQKRCFETSSDLIANPLLQPLANNGGETDTAALQAGSPAIDAADPAYCPATDQRGQARVGGCDIGAFEYVPPAPVVTPAAKTTPPPAPGSFRFKGVKLNVKKGTAKLKVEFSGSGTATLTGKGVKKVTKSVKSGVTKLGVVPAKKLKQTLAETGKAKVKVKVTFKTAVNTVTKTKKITLKLTS